MLRASLLEQGLAISSGRSGAVSRETFCSEKGQLFETQPALGARDCIFVPSHSLYMFDRLALYWV